MENKKGFYFRLSQTEWRYLFLLISLLFLFTILPFARERVFGINLIDFLFLAIILSGVYIASENNKILIIALMFALIGFAANVLTYFLENPSFLLISICFYMLFFVLIAIEILYHIIKSKEVTTDIIFGAICVYLLIGVIWGLLFIFIEVIHPGSFLAEQIITKATKHEFIHLSNYRYFIYYSFVTLTTLGYGDITPLAGPARSLSALEAVTGQLYIAILIARLVGLHISHSIKKESKQLKDEDKRP